MPFPYKDNRDYIADLLKTGDVQVIDKEVDWNLEAGAILRRCYELELPAPFFQKIKGYPKGFRLFGGTVATSRRASTSMGMPIDTHLRDLQETWLERGKKRVKPVIVNKKNAPCKENIMLGDDVDLWKFPAPMLHEGDGGRYILTWHANITVQPDIGWTNWGMYRAMVHTKNKMGGLMWKFQHIGGIYYQYWTAKGIDRMPIALAIGIDPVSSMVSAARIPYAVDEQDVSGAISGRPVELVKCETLDLYVPAHAEIVIEATVSTQERDWEGPFGEFTGYRASPRDRRPVYRVQAITYRNDPILTMSCMGMPVDDSDIVQCIGLGPYLLEDLRRVGLPVRDLSVHPRMCGLAMIISVKTPYAHIASRVAEAAWASEPGKDIPYCVVVQDDVDPWDLPLVFHAIASKCHPDRGITKIPHAVGHALMPFLTRQERLNELAAKVYFDCTWPTDWDPSIAVPPRGSFGEIYSKPVQEHVLNNWAAYGFKAGIPPKKK